MTSVPRARHLLRAKASIDARHPEVAMGPSGVTGGVLLSRRLKRRVSA